MIEHILNHCKTKTAITDLIGTDPFKMFPFDVPKSIKDSLGISHNIRFPYVLLEAQSGEDVEYLEGRSGTIEMYYTVSAVHVRGIIADKIYRAVKNAIGHAIHEQWDGIHVHRSHMGFPGLPDEPATDGSDDSVYYAVGTLYVMAEDDSQ